MNKDGDGVEWISLASVGYDGYRVAQYLLLPHLVFQPTWGGGAILAFSSFFNQIPHQKKSEISVGILSPT